MRRRRSPRPAASFLVVALGSALLGCGGEPQEEKPVALKVYVPCVISAPMVRVAAAYGASHPEVEVAPETEKPVAMLTKVRGEQGEAAAIVTMGDVEMRWLAKAGVVEPADVRTIGINTYPLVVIAAADGAPGAERLSDLAGPAVKRIFIEDPAQSSLGDRAVQALKALELWDEIAPKVVQPDPNAMVLGELIAGKADAAVVFRDCLFEGGGSDQPVPKTLRIIGELPKETHARIPYQAAALKGAGGREAAREFVDFLAGPEGKRALEEAGLRLAEAD